jgi:outer membrane protein assembly factor BamB
VADGLVYVTSGDGGTGDVVWNDSNTGALAPAVANGVVYSNQNGFSALSASTGALLWNSGLNSAKPAVANGVVYVGSDNNVDALKASTGTLLWSYATGAGVLTRPAVADGVVYVGSGDGKVYAFGLTGGNRRKSASARPDWRALRPVAKGGDSN